MKKILYCAAMALAVVLVGCNPPVEDNKYTSISLKPNSLTMISGDTTQISLLYQPASAAHPDATWTSSDTNIVKVIGKGIIAAKDTMGHATITAQVNELTATCEVKVDTYRNLIGFKNIIWFDTTPIGEAFDTITKRGNTFKIQMVSCPMVLLDTIGFDAVSYAGAGYAVLVDVAVYEVTEGQYKGYLFSDPAAILRTDSLDTEYAALAGSFDPAIVGAAVDEYYASQGTEEDEEKFYAAYEEGAKGAYIGIVRGDGSSFSLGAFQYATVTNGYFGTVYNEEGYSVGSIYNLDVEWLNYVRYGFGCALDWETSLAEDAVVLKKPYEKDAEEVRNYSNESMYMVSNLVKPSQGAIMRNLPKIDNKETINLGKPVSLKVLPASAR